MILTIIAILAVVIGLVMANSNHEVVESLGLLSFVTGVFATFIMVPMIIIAHIGVDVDIERNRIEYEALCERLEIVDSGYEDVSKSDVIRDVAEWNKNVYKYKHWANNPWTSWFFSKRVADSVEMIDLEGGEE